MEAGAGEDTIVPERGEDGASALGVGIVAGERYRVTRFLGAGGMGEVYEAEDLVLGGSIALKTLRPALANVPDAIDRLRREIAIARKVTHPNVCRIHDVGEHAGCVFLTMELLAGPTLAEHVRGRDGLDAGELDRIVPQLIAGLAALHAAGIVHRDFKPSNVILVDGRAVITDFGLARSMTADGSDSTTGEASLRGTPAYMAPEQVEGRPVTAASDLYSLGIVMFELATGRVPFREDTPLATATARLHKEPADPWTLRKDLSARWRNAIVRCLERAPSARPQRAEDVVAPVPKRRRRMLAAVTVAVVAATLALVWTTRTPNADEPTRFPVFERFTPADPRVRELFERANERMAADDDLAALDLFQEASRIAPDDPVLLARQAMVLDELGFEERAQASLARALEHSAGAGDDVKLWLDAWDSVHRTGGNASVTLLRRLVAIAPGEYDFEIELFALLVRLERTVEAAAVLDDMQQRFSGLAVTANLEVKRALVARMQNDRNAMVLHAGNARSLAHAAKLPRQEGWAEVWLGNAALAFGEQLAAKHAFERAITLLTPTGDAGGVMWARKRLADVFAEEGDWKRQAEQYDQTVAFVRPLGNRSLLLNVLDDSSGAYMMTGRIADARKALDEAVVLANELENDLRLWHATIMRGRVAAMTGDLAAAATLVEESYRIADRAGRQLQRDTSAALMAELCLERDDDACVDRWVAIDRDGVSIQAGWVKFRRGDLTGARRTWTAVRDRKPSNAVRATASALLAWLAVRDGRSGEARELIELARPYTTGLQLGVIPAEAELRAAGGDLRGALASIDANVARLRAAGDVYDSVGVEALGVELASRGGDPSATARRTRAIEIARASGFARRARELSR